MKKIGKLSINPEKVIKNEELVNLRGGYGGGSGSLYCKNSSGTVCAYDNYDCGTFKEDLKYCKDNCDDGIDSLSCIE